MPNRNLPTKFFSPTATPNTNLFTEERTKIKVCDLISIPLKKLQYVR